MPIYLVLLVIRGCSFLDGLWQAPKPYSKRGTLYIACQNAAREQWIAARRRELLPTRYMHVVFTLPRRLAPLVLRNKKVIYDLLFRASAETLLEVASDPRLLGAEIGFFSVLHNLIRHFLLHLYFA